VIEVFFDHFIGYFVYLFCSDKIEEFDQRRAVVFNGLMGEIGDGQFFFELVKYDLFFRKGWVIFLAKRN